MAVIDKRPGPDGKSSFRVRIRLKGKPSKSRTFRRRTDAKKWADETEAALRRGRPQTIEEAERHTLAELVDRYVEQVSPEKRSQRDTRRQLEWWKDQIGDRPLADITPPLIAEYRDKLKRGDHKPRSPATVVRYLAALSHAFSIATREWQWTPENPVRKVTRPKEPRGRIRFLSDDERTHLLNECKYHPSLYAAVVLSLSTGARQGEILGLRWRDIDLQRGRITLHQTKNDERRALPLAGHALAVMREYSKVRNLDSDLVFPGRVTRDKPAHMREAFERALQRADIEDFRWHDLRHTAASYLAMNGATLAEIAEVLGHKTLAMVKRYAHLSDEHVSEVVASMNERMFGMQR